jgi:iron-sulfur cluster assembly protein
MRYIAVDETESRMVAGPAATEPRTEIAPQVEIAPMTTQAPATRAPRPRPKVMTLTDAAAERVRQIMSGTDKPIAGIKVGVKNGGCAGMEYTMTYAEAVEKFDVVVEDKGVKILIDPKAILFLLGTEMDYKIDKLKAGFVFNNPNQTSACGCGESVSITPRKPDEIAATAAE